MAFEVELATRARPLVRKSPKAALAWALVLGPLGLCYLSVFGGVVATMVTAVAVLVGSPAMLAVLWPVAVALSLPAVRHL
ncbi:hypothetical protein [Amycolatopsis magusensis]|uniref:hypothetical protein n=1 Tax=Amycolatopsis magusensis TaxID=882444 RepID=UPI003C2DFB0D